MTADISRLHKALKRIEKEHKKDAADLATRAARDVGYRSMSFTPFASAAKIEKDTQRHIGSIVARSLKAKGIKRTKAAFDREKQRVIARRRSGTKSRRAGWIPGILALGGTIRGATGGVLKPGGGASKGYGKKANIFTLTAVIANAIYRDQDGKNEAKSRGEMEAGLARAVKFVADDREKYLKKKTEQMLRRNSD